MTANGNIIYTIAKARPHDVPLLPPIELAAARLLAGHAPESVLSVATSLRDFEEAQRQGRLFVALANDAPVGFAHMKLLEPKVAHLEEIDVHPQHGRRGVGTKLVETVCAWAAANGCRSVTLTTFRDVPFNMPFYAHHGFVEIPPVQQSAVIVAMLQHEAHRGLDPLRRVAMRRVL